MPQDIDVVDGGTILSPATIKLIAAVVNAAELEAVIEPVRETQSGGDLRKPPTGTTPTQMEFDF